MQEAYLFPLSFAQQRLWFLDQLSPGNPFYNITTGIQLRFPLQIDTAELVLNELVRRHEVLRTRFVTHHSKPYQLVLPELHLRMELVDISGLPQPQQQDTVQVMINNEVRNGFELARGPLIRTKMLKLGPADFLFLVSMHHIISDGWSVGLFFQEFRSLYEAFSQGRPSPLPELEIQYADYAVWQRDWLKGAVLEEHLNYWKKQLAGVPELQLETDFKRPGVQSYKGAHYQKTYSKRLLKALQAMSKKEGVTLFMSLLAAFFVLLHRYSGQSDIVIGTPIAGRNRAELEGLIGFFINNLIFRADLSGNPAFKTLLAQVRRVALDAYAHQELPFEKLVEELNLARDLSRNPIFQITFQLINTPILNTTDGPGNEHIPVRGKESQNVQRGTAMFDMAFDLIEVPDGLMVQLEYSTDLFRRETIERFVSNYETLLENIAADPDRQISELKYFDEATLRQQLQIRQAPLYESAPVELVHRILEQQAARVPDQTALHFQGSRLSFRQLNERANQLAHCLIGRGIRPDMPVGVCLPSSFNLIVAILGVLKAGGAYVPLDPAYPQERLALMTRDIRYVISNNAYRTNVGNSQHLDFILLDELVRQLEQMDTANPDVTMESEHLAYVLYTSGSTGRPKGVMIPHAALLNHMNWMKETYPLEPDDRVLQRTSFSFDASVWEIFAPLLEGAQLVLVDQHRRGDSHYLSELIAKEKISVVQTVPALLSLLHETGLLLNASALKRVFCGGEALPNALCNAFLAHYPAIGLINLYGPTEATIDATYWPCTPLDENFPSAPIGKPISHMQAYILDEYLQPVPEGVPGEIYLSGRSVGRGYYQQPDLTAERFLPDPFAQTEGALMYRTGDLGKWLPDGNILFKGRTDDQIKLRGYRIELGEIEAVLHQHPEVSQVVVVLHKEGAGQTEIAAYYTAKTDISDALRTFAESRLPEYMVPALMVRLEKLPLTPNGKIDRRALPAPSVIRESRQQEFIAPETALEVLMAEIWSDILGLRPVGLEHNFFRDLGGHSLLATQVISQVRSLLQLEVPLQRIFEHPTLRRFIDAILQDAPSAENVEKTAEVLLNINQLSEEEIDRLLAE